MFSKVGFGDTAADLGRCHQSEVLFLLGVSCSGLVLDLHRFSQS